MAIEHIENSKTRLTILEAAAYIGVKPSTLAKWRMYDEGPDFIKVGKKIFYLAGDLNAYIYNRGNGKGGR